MPTFEQRFLGSVADYDLMHFLSLTKQISAN